MKEIYVLMNKQLHVAGHNNHYDTYVLATNNKTKQFYPSFSTKESANKFIQENNLSNIVIKDLEFHQ